MKKSLPLIAALLLSTNAIASDVPTGAKACAEYESVWEVSNAEKLRFDLENRKPQDIALQFASIGWPEDSIDWILKTRENCKAYLKQIEAKYK